MGFIEGSRGIYRPLRELFDTPIYEQTLQTCWHIGSYKSQIAPVTELLRLQQKNLLPSEVTAEDVTDLLVEESKSLLTLQLWELQLELFDEADVRPLLKQVLEVNTSMKMRDVEFEARRLLRSPETAPLQFQHPKIISQAQKYRRSLIERRLEAAPSSKLLHPWEVLMAVVPKVLQGLWLPPPNTSINMPSQQLSKMAIGVTKAVEDRVSTHLSSMLHQVSFSRSIRDNMVLSILKKVRQGYTLDILVKKLNCFAAEVLNTITDVTAEEICLLFQPWTRVSVNIKIKPDMMGGSLEDTVSLRETVSAIISPPPAPLTTSARRPAHTAIHNGLNSSLNELPAPRPEPHSTVVSTPSPPVTPAGEPPINFTVQVDLHVTRQPVKMDESFNGTTEAKKTEISGFSCFLSWLQKNICCCFLPEDDTQTE